jgi:ribose-phosphate pyrophosphokinase
MSIKFRGKTKAGWTVDLPFEAFTYPAGEAEIKQTGEFDATQYEHLIVDVRGYDSHTLFHLAMFDDVMRHINTEDVYPLRLKWYLFLPYFPGARSDRGVPFGASVYTEFILGTLTMEKVVVLDPHSPVIVDLLGVAGLVFPVERIIKREVQDGSSDARPQTYAGVIAPDHGAVARATAAAKVMGVPVYLGGKTRDFKTGKLSGFHMEDELPAEGKFLLVDDICDGGGTFVGLAEATGLPKERLDLWVTHGVFSKGLGALYNNFGLIHTTTSYFGDSHNDMENWKYETEAERLDVHDVTPYLYEALQA